MGLDEFADGRFELRDASVDATAQLFAPQFGAPALDARCNQEA